MYYGLQPEIELSYILHYLFYSDNIVFHDMLLKLSKLKTCSSLKL